MNSTGEETQRSPSAAAPFTVSIIVIIIINYVFSISYSLSSIIIVPYVKFPNCLCQTPEPFHERTLTADENN